MSNPPTTTRAPSQGPFNPATPQPGLLLVYQNGEPSCLPLPFSAGLLELGRGRGLLRRHLDPRMSRRHAQVHFDGGCFFVEDLGSQTGTYVNGVQLKAGRGFPTARVLRTGSSLFLFYPDLRPILAAGIHRDIGLVKGPALQAVYEQARSVVRFSNILHITGESGVGKEGVARVAHAAGAHSTGPFVAVNCATIAEGVAERLLFGARRGAYSGAVADTEGFVQAASGGTLFLDEIAELPLSVQAKLLRVVESQEVLPLGANRPVSVQLQLYSATHKNLRTEVYSGRFREDLYFRISRPKIGLPPLRQRMEELPWLVALALERLPPPLTAQPVLIEQCFLRYWPGNVRELLSEIRTAGLTALAAGRSVVESTDLCEDAGRRFGSTPPALSGFGSPPPPAVVSSSPVSKEFAPPLPPSPSLPEPAPTVPPAAPPPSRDEIEAALRKENGNISRAARALQLHRTQLKRFMQRFGLTASTTPDDSEG